MTANHLTLFCLVDGEATSNAFPVSASTTTTVGEFKDLIKAKQSPDFDDIVARSGDHSFIRTLISFFTVATRLSSSLFHLHHANSLTPLALYLAHISHRLSLTLAFSRSFAVSSTFTRQVQIENCSLSYVAVTATLDETMRFTRALYKAVFTVDMESGRWSMRSRRITLYL